MSHPIKADSPIWQEIPLHEDRDRTPNTDPPPVDDEPTDEIRRPTPEELAEATEEKLAELAEATEGELEKLAEATEGELEKLAEATEEKLG